MPWLNLSKHRVVTKYLVGKHISIYNVMMKPTAIAIDAKTHEQPLIKIDRLIADTIDVNS